jgi:hypothetical protein
MRFSAQMGCFSGHLVENVLDRLPEMAFYGDESRSDTGRSSETEDRTPEGYLFSCGIALPSLEPRQIGQD